MPTKSDGKGEYKVTLTRVATKVVMVRAYNEDEATELAEEESWDQELDDDVSCWEFDDIDTITEPEEPDPDADPYIDDGQDDEPKSPKPKNDIF